MSRASAPRASAARRARPALPRPRPVPDARRGAHGRVRAVMMRGGHHQREHHQAGAVGGRHQERPHRQARQADAHPAPARMTMAHEAIAAEADQQAADDRAQQVLGDDESRESRERQHGADRQQMTEAERHQRAPDRAPVAFLHPEGDREQPAHPRVQSVERAQSGERDPRPEHRVDRVRHGHHLFILRPPRRRRE